MRNESTRGGLRDALVREAWRATVLSMIFTLMLAACGSAYAGLFDLIDGAWIRAAFALVGATLAGGGLAWLCGHREDLIDA